MQAARYLSECVAGATHFVALFPVERDNQRAAAAVVAVFAQVDALPGADVQASIGDGDRQAVSEQAAFQVRGHVVATFIRMAVVRFILRHQAIKETLEILPHRGVGILINR